MTRPTVKITMDTLDRWLKEAWDQCWDDVSANRVNQDHLTASDLIDAIRLKADITAGCSSTSRDEARWWGYGRGYAWARLKITDKPSLCDLLGLVRDWLANEVREGRLEAHNFGRGHCSGMRFRKAGTGLSEAEQKTVERKTREKPIHAARTTEEGRSTGYALCSSGGRGRRSMGSRIRSGTRLTRDANQITCKRCLNLLKRAEA